MKRLPEPQCLLLDLDGNLVDSVADLAASANATRLAYGLTPIDASLVASYVGDGAGWLIKRTLADAPDSVDRDEALQSFRAHYLEHCLERTQLYPGVLQTLAAIGDLPMAIVSNKPQAMCEKIAEGLGLNDHVDVVVGARRGVPVKPDPALLEVAVRELELSVLDRRHVWMVGDSANDVRSGQAFGASTVGVTYGIGDPTKVEPPSADAIIDRFQELAVMIDASRSDA